MKRLVCFYFLNLFFILSIFSSNLFAFNCPNKKWATYVAIIEVQNDKGDPIPGALIYSYPKTEYEHDGGGNFSRTDGYGSTSNELSICIPDGVKPPEFIKVKCTVEDGLGGEYYSSDLTVVKFFRKIKGKDPTVYPVILIKK